MQEIKCVLERRPRKTQDVKAISDATKELRIHQHALSLSFRAIKIPFSICPAVARKVNSKLPNRLVVKLFKAFGFTFRDDFYAANHCKAASVINI